MKKRTKTYEEYRQKFTAEKELGNVKLGVKMLRHKQFKAYLKKYKTVNKVLGEQVMLKSKAEKNRVWREYKRLKKTYSRGETKLYQNKYFRKNPDTGEVELQEEERELFYHYNMSGLLHDKMAIHLLISERILEGEDRIEVLADYGY